MQVILLNNSGNVGKSFFAREFFYPNLKNAKIAELESNNSSSSDYPVDTVTFRANEIDTLNRLILSSDDLIIDVGASQIERFFEELKKNEDLIEDIDLIVVPVPQNVKEMEDSLTLLELISEQDLDIRVEVFLNKCTDLKEFDFFINEAKERGFNVDKNLVFEEYHLIKTLDKSKLLSSTVANSDKDFKALAKEAYRAGDEKLGDEYSDKKLLKSQCKTFRKVLDQKFAYLVSKG